MHLEDIQKAHLVLAENGRVFGGSWQDFWGPGSPCIA